MIEENVNLKYRVDLVEPDDDLKKVLPKLLFIPIFGELYKEEQLSRVEKNSIIKYLVLLYDPGSSYIAEFLDLSKRKIACAQAAGFSRRGDKGWQPLYKQFINVDSDLSRNLILAFLKDHKNNIWREIVTTENELEELTELRWEKIKKVKTTTTSQKKGEKKPASERTTEIADKDIFEATSKKEKLLEACQKRIEYLETLYKKFYSDNKDVHDAVKQMPITPENVLSFVNAD